MVGTERSCLTGIESCCPTGSRPCTVFADCIRNERMMRPSMTTSERTETASMFVGQFRYKLMDISPWGIDSGTDRDRFLCLHCSTTSDKEPAVHTIC